MRFNSGISLLVIFFICIVAIVFLHVSDSYGNSSSVESQVVKILKEEALHGPVKAGVVKVRYITDHEKRLPDAQLSILEEELTAKFTQSLLQEIKKSGQRDAIALVERDRLDLILKEKQLQATGLTEQTASSIGGLAGLDLILLATARGNADAVTSVKVIRVKDGAILGLVDQSSGQMKLIDAVTDVRAHSWNAMPFMLRENGIVTIAVNVERGNSINISLMASSEFEKFKKEKTHREHPEFEARKTKNYNRSAYLVEGEYILVLSDKAHGVTSSKTSDIRINAYLERE